VGDLETLEAVTALGLATNNIENLVNKLGTFSVMTLGPVVASTGLTENEVVGTEKLAEGTGTDSVHRTGLEIDKDSAGNILVTGSLVEVDAHTLELELRGAVVHAIAVKTMLARNSLPEGSTDLVTALTGLEVDDLTHLECC
jgi:hypothetical protein